jgi:hypothetical protein
MKRLNRLNRKQKSLLSKCYKSYQPLIAYELKIGDFAELIKIHDFDNILEQINTYLFKLSIISIKKTL